MNRPIEFTYGFTIEIFSGEEDVHGRRESKKYSLTGRFPSPAYADLASVASATLDFLNGHFGTNFVVVELVSAPKTDQYIIYEEKLQHRCGDCGEKLQEVRPGKYQCVNCEKEEVK